MKFLVRACQRYSIGDELLMKIHTVGQYLNVNVEKIYTDVHNLLSSSTPLHLFPAKKDECILCSGDFVCACSRVARSSGKIPDFRSFSGLFPVSGFWYFSELF